MGSFSSHQLCWMVCIMQTIIPRIDAIPATTMAGITHLPNCSASPKRTAEIKMLKINFFIILYFFSATISINIIIHFWHNKSRLNHFTWNLLKKSYTHLYENNNFLRFCWILNLILHDRKTILDRENPEKEKVNIFHPVFCIFISIFDSIPRIQPIY